MSDHFIYVWMPAWKHGQYCASSVQVDPTLSSSVQVDPSSVHVAPISVQVALRSVQVVYK